MNQKNNTNSSSSKVKYDAEFRAKLVEVWHSGTYESVAKCAASYGIKESTLHTWIGKARQANNPVVQRDPDYVKLEKENAKLKMELEILKNYRKYAFSL